MVTGLLQRVTQEEFGSLVGISQPRVAQLIDTGSLSRDGTCAQWLLGYCERLREQAAGRGQELTIERAGLARAQRIGQELKNRVAQGEYAPVGLLTDVLAVAAASVVDRFDALSGDLRKVCPDLPDAARNTLESAISSARNEWVRSTSSLAMQIVDELSDEDEDTASALGADDDCDLEPVSAALGPPP